jgi:hypothetical protein
MKLLRSMHAEMGPLRDALVYMVAENMGDYPTGCTCLQHEHKRKPKNGHLDDCPASKHGSRYVEHLYRRRKEREAMQRAEEHLAEQERVLEKAFGQDDVEFVADLKGKLEKAGLTDDVRTRCPECHKKMIEDGVHMVCAPCGVRIIKDVTDAEVPGTNDVEVWHCPACDQCYTFRAVKLFPTAVIMAGDEIPPTTCFACNGALEQWTTYRPIPRDGMLKLMGRVPPGAEDDCLPGVGPIESVPVRDDPFHGSPEIEEEYMRGRFGSKGQKVSRPDDDEPKPNSPEDLGWPGRKPN